nr:MAG TPA: Major capsid protein [Microviridae sp.]
MARNNINSVLLKRPKRNKFDLSRVNKLTCEAGEIVPFFLEECLPDDSFKLATANRIRLAPQVLPLMHQIDVSMYWFFVPCRILWPNWEEFITGGKDGTSEPIIPYFNFGQGSSSLNKTAGVGMLSDYLGIPTNAASNTPSTITGQSYNFMPFAAYVKIYNDYFRDENFTKELPFELSDGYQTLSHVASDNDVSSCIQTIYAGTISSPAARSWQRIYGGCFLASWKKEYFTSALPNTQRGPVVNIPLGDNAPVVYKNGTKNVSLRMVDQTSTGTFTNVEGNFNGNHFDLRNSDVVGIGQMDIYADLSEATNTNIIELRRAFRIQEFLERMNAGGSRLTEMIYSMFGVKSPDARLQRAEFIGASHNPVLVDAIYQTSASQENSPLADFAGKAISVGGQKPISYYCKEHGYIMGLMVIRPRPEYQNITRRHWLHGLTGKFDYFWPILANIGDQAILNRELFPAATNAQLNEPFGYTPRYQEYRFAPSETHGEMQSTLKYFHMNRIFNSLPVLNQQFMNCNPRTDMFAVTDGEVSHHYWCEILIGCQAKRPIPKFGTPML